MPGGVRRWVGGFLSVVLLLSLAAAAPQSLLVEPPDVVYRYDAAGRLQVVSDPWAGESAYYRHDPAGNLTEIDRDVDPPGAAWRTAGQTGPAPVVSQVAPVVARPGDVVTVTGAHFTGDPRTDLVMVGEASYAEVVSAAAGELRVRVPPVAATGAVSVATPYGTGHGGDELFVVPWAEVEPDRVAASVRTGFGEPAEVALAADDAVGLVAFDGMAGQSVTVSADGGGGSVCERLRFGLSGPGGVEVVGRSGRDGWCGGDPAGAVRLPADGTYTLLVTPAQRAPDAAVSVTLVDAGAAGPPAEAAASTAAPSAPAEEMLDGSAMAPVALGTGALRVAHTDLLLWDVVEVPLTRRPYPVGAALPQDRGPFGIGGQLDFAAELVLSSALQYADLAVPGGVEVPFARVTDGADAAGAVFEAVGAGSPLAGASIRWNGHGWDLTTVDGVRLVFADDDRRARLWAVVDRRGNQVRIHRERSQTGRNGEVLSVHSPSGRSFTLEYDDEQRVVEARDHLGRQVGYDYDADGMLAHVSLPDGSGLGYEYGERRRITAITDEAGDLLVGVDYDDGGRVSRQELADGSEFTFDYVEGEQTIEVGDDQATVTAVVAAEVVDPGGSVRRVEFDRGHWVSDSFDVGGHTHTLTVTRDPQTGYVTELVDPDGVRTRYGYDPGGNLTSVTEAVDTEAAWATGFTHEPVWHEVASVTTGAGHRWGFEYDQAGNLTAEIAPDGSRVGYGYDQQGRLTSVTDPAGAVTRIDYELAHRVTITDPAGNSYQEFYDAGGRLAAVTDPTGHTQRFGYDAADRLISVSDPAGGQTRFGYDGRGNLVELTDPGGDTTSYTYDAADRVLARTDPAGAGDRYTYDDLGHLTAHVDRRGVRTEFDYDGLGRLVAVAYGVDDEGAAESTVEYRYDAADRLLAVEDSEYGTIEFGYDPLGRLTSETTVEGEVAYRYDPDGQLVATVLPDGTEIGYRYDDAGRLVAVGHDQAMTTVSYDDTGRVVTAALPGGVTADYDYDGRGLLAEISYHNTHGGQLGDLRYDYDQLGRRAGASGTLAGVTLPPAHTDTRHDPGNRLTHHQGTSLRYDPAGNLLTDGTHTYTWNARGQLVAVDGPTSATFDYDPFGRRVAVTADGDTTRYVHDGDNVAQQLLPDGSTATYLTGPGLDELFARTVDGITHTYLTDVQGSVLGLVGPDGNLTTQYHYDPYGATTVTGTPEANPFGYTGRELDPTGLYYLRHRYYHPQLGRFISEDPLGFAAGDTNLYAYVFNDPINHTDPHGLQAAAGIGACLATGAWALGEVQDILDNFASIMDPEAGDPFNEANRIELDHLNRRSWDAFWTYVTTCGASMAVPLPGLGAPLAGSLGRTAPTLAGRTPSLATRLPGARPSPTHIRPPAGGGRPPAGRACSFASDTLVLLADGNTTPIAELEIGDQVLATDPVTGATGSRQITHTWAHIDTLWDLHTEAGTITTTANHPFWNHTEQRWDRADTLQPGDQLLTPDGRPVNVTELDSTATTDHAHNLTVADLHTYYVLAGNTPVLVHNTCPEVARLTSSPNAPVINSKTVYTDRNGRFRIDVENQNPGQRGANIHLQPMGRGGSGKYYYHQSTGQWISESGEVLAPRIANQVPQSAINKAYRYLGITPP
ncbi:hypothetical protein JQS43_10590 [Natronosporangium hydrolyticum]|uniref:Hint domain-containing protein n=1 Tax=Natronosporangium hydrolyticum TaxID=2811111 RepID=A0A895YGJ1_9ACTN|nr:RHS repeat-associated core domain-containing protein [Natronosporangium hydrolyticum]QSB16681.1 hypothetical protein JQS43_10590 [Natronosporangium hydrolyticum]